MTRKTLFTVLLAAGTLVAPLRATPESTRDVRATALAPRQQTQSPPDQQQQQQQTPPPQQPTEFVLSLTNAGRKWRMALPDFFVVGSDAKTTEAGKTVSDVLWSDLEFEQELYMIPRTETARIPVGADPADIAYDQWAQLGADFLGLGTIRPSANGFDVEFRVMAVSGTRARQQLFGFKYGCKLEDPRYCAHFMSDDFYKKRFNLDGVARTKIAFSSDRDVERMAGRHLRDAGLGKQIYIADYDGANEQRITVNTSLNVAPTWAPDGTWLVYTSWLSGEPDLYIQNIHEARAPQRPAHAAPGQNQLGAWSPDGKQLAFASNRGGEWHVWVVNRDGTGLRQVTTHPKGKIDNAPTWSPTGTQIAFTSDRSGTNQIYIINQDGTGLTQITHEGKTDRPTWSVLNKIAYTWESGGGGLTDINMIDLLTMKISTLTDGRFKNEQPSFSPNGRHIVFTTTRYGKEHLAIIGLDGRLQRRLTETGNNDYPNWSSTPGQ